MGGVLDGVRVIEVHAGAAGAIAGMLLAGQGADVVKVEPPEGDPLRETSGHVVWDRSKRSVVLDLTTTGDRGRFGQLCATADVVIDGFTPTEASDVGFRRDALRTADERLITCSITAYGPAGPGRDRPAHDALVQARSGLMYEQPGHRPGPIFLHAPLPSMGAALLAVTGISAALLVRESTGRGQAVETSLLQGSLVWTTQIWKRAERPTPVLNDMWAQIDLPPTPCFEDADGQWFHPMINGLPHTLAHLGRARDELDVGAVMRSDRAARERLFAGARAVFRQRPRDEWLALFREIDVACQPIQPFEAIADHPQARHTGAVTTVELPGVGPVAQAGPAYTLSGHTGGPPGPPPALGAHTDEVLGSPGAAVRTVPAATGARPRRHALEGVRVLDLGTVVAGPFGGMILADLGAEVIKVEPIRGGFGGETGDATWVSGARGKRCIAVDLKSDDGQVILRRLIEGADVIHYNLRQGVAERLGFGYEQARALNPRIVFSHLTGYGSSGPMAGWPGSDQMAQALCGIEWEQGATDAGGHPSWLRFGLTDAISGLLCVIGVLQALAERERTGLGQKVETDILRAGMLLASDGFVGPASASLPRRPKLDGEQTGRGPYERLYETADGWLCVVAPTAYEQDALRRILGVDEKGFAAAFRARPTSAWLEALDGAGVAGEEARSRTDDWFDGPDVAANGFVVAYEHPVWGRLEQPGPFVRLSETPGRIETPPPLLGQHTREVLRDLGYDEASIDALHERGVVRSASLPLASASPNLPTEPRETT
jgi:crotonobetainyl-CoA:carnitine CoA-transferase CaiB-like acyl-CoA transferase